MFKKLVKHGLLMTVGILLLGVLVPKSFAVDFSEHEIALEQSESVAFSSVVMDDRSFNAVAIQSDKEIDDLMVNFGNGWEPVGIHNHGYGYEALIFNSPTHTVQFKSDDSVKLKTHLFYYEPEPAIGGPEVSDLSDLYASTQLVARDLRVISRNEWGADETMRYWTPEKEEASTKDDSGEEPVDPCAGMDEEFEAELGLSYVRQYSPSGDLLTWPLQYMKRVRKIVIHHTDSEIRDMNGDHRTDSMDYKAMVRAIYQYHSLSRGWGDIGYNYIIDPLGNIYEGRYGGDRVIGAHALCYNNGSMGIAVIGDYGYKSIPEPALNSLISLIALKTKEHSISPTGYSDFRGKRLPNIIGHRDIRATSCPGDQLYSLLPKIRQRASLAIRSGAFQESGLQLANLDYNAEPLTDFGNIVLKPNERKTITLRFKNTGKQSWDHNTWMHVALNNNPQARVVPVIEDKAFVAADMKERSVEPGQIGSFDVMIEGGYYAGYYSFQVAPVVNGRYKVSRAIVNLAFSVEAPNYSYEVVDQNLPSGAVFQGEKIQAWVDIRNTGNVIWKNHGENQITLGTSGPRDRKSVFIENNPSRLGYLYESEIRPGQIGHFVMDLQIPAYRTGLAIEQFTPVIERISWMQDKALGFKVDIKEPRHLARITKLNNISRLLPGEMFKLELQMENIGDLAWDMDNMEVIFLNRGLKVFKNHLVPLEPVDPGEKVNFDFWVQAPYQEGYHSIFLRSRFNDVPIKGGTARYAIQVPNPIMRAQLVDRGSEYINVKPGEEKEITVKFKNVGNVIWRNKGPNVIHLGSSAPRDRLSNLYYKDGWENKYRPANLQEKIVRPGGIGTFTFKIKPENKGIYREGFQLVIENVGWIFESSVNWIFRVFGERVESSTSLSDAEINKERISVITQATTTTTTTPTVTETPEPVYTPPTVTERPFRVRLSYNDENSILTADKNFIVTDGDNNELFTLSAGEEINVRRLENNIHAQVGDTVKSGSVIRLIPEESGIMEIKTWENRPAWNRSLNDNRFRGAVEIRVVNDQTAYINELSLGDYLKGLAEVSNDAHFEKQKTIAVLARTYARFYMEDENRKFPGLPYDGSDDPAVFQRYLGYGYEARSPSFAGAVLITKDEVVTYQGKLVKTPYFNQSDGRTRSAKEVWGWTDTPYLQSVADPWCEGRYKRGHGVGLSGFGATSQANEGKTYDEIIKYYYQGVEVEELNFE